MKTFDSLEQRMISTYLDTFPPFVPDESGPSKESQEQLYHFTLETYQQFFDKPTLLLNELHEDDAHDNRFNKSSYGKPELRVKMRAVTKAIDSFFELMIELGKAGCVYEDKLSVDGSFKIKKQHLQLFKQLGFHISAEDNKTIFSHDKYKGLFHTWVWMSNKPEMTLLKFSRCLFWDGYNYGSFIYRKLFGNEEAFLSLENFFIERGYARIDNRESDKISVDYVKGYNEKELIRGGFNYGVRHTGISCNYDNMVKKPPFIGLCIYRMKDVLQNFASMDERTKKFVTGRTKRCDRCGYCVQGKLDGKRALAYVDIEYNAAVMRLCTYFPGYSYCWTALDEEIVSDMIAMTIFMDSLFSKNK